MAKPAATVDDDSAVQPRRPRSSSARSSRSPPGPPSGLDERIGVAGLGRPFFRKVFPDHWSFLLGEIALYSFIVLLLTGVFLTIWFKPSMAEVEYEGTYQLLRGMPMSEAYASTLEPVLRHPRRSAACGRCTTGRRMLFVAAMLDPQPADLLHRRVPQAARDQLADRRRPARPRPHRGLRRLLAAGRPAVGHRPAVRRRSDPVDPGDRHLG